MELETLYITKREEWRKWLTDNFQKKTEIWLVYPKKASRKPRIEYNTAVEEALCFGWIDSTVKSLDNDHTIQRFCKRRAKSNYSQTNKERIHWLLKQGKIHSSLIESLEEIIKEPFKFPNDIISKIKEDETTWKNYQGFSDPYKRIRIAFIDSARKRKEEFDKRLNNFIKHTKDNKIIKGFGGIDKYY